MSDNPYQKYKSTQYETASQGKLLIMLYDGAIKFGKQAKKGIEQNNIELANNKLNRVQAIINELMATLDIEKGGEIAQGLESLYDYMNRRLIQANVNKDPKIVEEVLDLLKELKEVWEEAEQKLKKQPNERMDIKR